MLRIQVASDLHLETYADFGRRVLSSLAKTAKEVDLLILAGDIAESRTRKGFRDMVKFVSEEYKRVVFVPGNHDYYGHDLSLSFSEIAEYPNVELLLNRRITIDGYSIAGTTLWFEDTASSRRYSRMLSDFFRIRDFARDVYIENRIALDFLAALPQTDIVITHHLPLMESVAPEYEGDPCNCFFLCDVSGLLKNIRPKLIVHGHTHTPSDYPWNGARVVCNPRGYALERPTGYREGFCVEVE